MVEDRVRNGTGILSTLRKLPFVRPSQEADSRANLWVSGEDGAPTLVQPAQRDLLQA